MSALVRNAAQASHAPGSALRGDDGERWTVRAAWEDGTFEEIAGFENEAEANDWITNKFQIWFEEVSKARAT